MTKLNSGRILSEYSVNKDKMARPKSDDKRNAILAAAIAVFAERGIWQAPTSAVSRAAGVAEGTLFTYFPNKDALLNELYRALKQEMADALLDNFPTEADVRSRVHHIWQRYVRWGMANPAKRKVLAELGVSDRITAESRDVGNAPFAEIERMAADSAKRQLIYPYPMAFVAAMLNGMAETTIAVMAQNSAADLDYSEAGFEVFWRGIAKA